MLIEDSGRATQVLLRCTINNFYWRATLDRVAIILLMLGLAVGSTSEPVTLELSDFY